jgi:hypothetical protein
MCTVHPFDEPFVFVLLAQRIQLRNDGGSALITHSQKRVEDGIGFSLKDVSVMRVPQNLIDKLSNDVVVAPG